MPDSHPIAYLDGEFVPFAEARLPVYDLGVMQAATVTERMRTVRHQPYLVAEHISRLQSSLAAVGWRMPLDMGPIEEVIAELVRVNVRELDAGLDLSIVLFVTAGQNLIDSNGIVRNSRPTVCACTAPLPLESYANSYLRGVRLRVPKIRHIPSDTISPEIKHRSRLHWFLAEQEVQLQDPLSHALLLDERGFVTETSTGNLFVVRDNELLTPTAETTLGGIAQSQVCRLAEAQGWTVRRKDIRAEEVSAADEVFLTSSTYLLLPVSHLNGDAIGNSLPGRVTKMLIDIWGEEIGLDFERQALDQQK